MKTKIFLTFLILTNIYGNNLDSFFKDDVIDATEEIIEMHDLENKKKIQEFNKFKENHKKQVIYVEDEKIPNVVFKQPEVYNIYTRDELRSWNGIDAIISSGWKTIIVGKHQLILNDEIKNK